jgi:hypothetical protein
MKVILCEHLIPERFIEFEEYAVAIAGAQVS